MRKLVFLLLTAGMLACQSKEPGKATKNDFSIEWSGVREIYSTTRFLITLKDGRRINGNFKSTGAGR